MNTYDLVRQAQRVYRRYQIEVVEAFGFCPWACQAREEGRVDVRVVLDGAPGAPHPASPSVLDIVDEIAAATDTEIGILLFPRCELGRVEWERWHADLREADAARYPFHAAPMASAAFHPDAGAPADTTNGDLLKPFIRRSPDPLIQLVRVSTLAAVKGDRTGGTRAYSPQEIAGLDLDALQDLTARRKPLSQSVADANLRTTLREGVARIEAVLDDIRRDRDRSYGGLQG